ncbi:MAG: hypothetical protein FJX76_16645 [Armatimonadetes bacterium]|nr:hypothetical protein [Armatimonadota bacterium]
MRAKLTVPDAPEAGAGVRRMELDCAHGVTSGYFVRGSDAVSEVDILNLKKGRDAFGRERLDGSRAVSCAPSWADREREDT